MLCLQETYIKEEQKPSLKNYEGYFYNRTNARKASGGAAIFIRKTYHSEKLNLHSNLETIAISLNLPNNITVCNIYIPPKYDLQQSEIDKLMNQLPKPMIVLGDFNAHNPILGISRYK